MKALSETLLGRLLGLLAGAVIRHRRLFLYPQFLLLGLCVVYTVCHLEFDANRDDLVGSDKPYHRNFLNFKKEFPAQDDLVAVVESENSEKNRQFVERLGARLELETNLFTDVFYKGDLKMMGRKALLFVPDSDLRDMSKTLEGFLPFIQRFTQATNLVSMFELVNAQISHASHEANPQNEALMKALPMLGRIANQAAACLDRAGAPPSPGIYALFGAGEEAEQEIYISFAKGRIYLATARARTEEQNGAAVERMRELAAETQREVTGLNVGITGEPVLEHDEMVQSQKDATLASIVSLVICALIFIYGYSEVRRPLMATLCLLFGLGYTLAFTTLVVGHLNILTVTFFPILIGMAIDFGVHLITRYEEELRLGRDTESAMRKAMVFTGQGVFTGAMTTAAAFLAMALTNFKGIQEMGLICGAGMIICLVPMMTMLPVMLLSVRRPAAAAPDESAPEPVVRSRIENLWLSRPGPVIVVTLALCAVAASELWKVYFDYDLLNMQSAGLPAVVFEKKLIAASLQGDARSVLFGAVVADTPEEARKLEEKLAALPAVATNISMAHYLGGDNAGKLKLIGQIKQQIAPVHFQPPDDQPVQLSELSRVLYYTQGYMGAIADDDDVKAAAQAAQKSPPPIHNNDQAPAPKPEADIEKQVLAVKDSLSALRKKMWAGDPVLVSRKLAEFQQALFNDVHDTFQSIHDQDNSSPLEVKDLPPALLHRFVGVHGKMLIQVYPKKDIWNRDNQAEFVRQIRQVVPNVTGTPVQLLEYTSLLKDSYVQAAYYALAAIALMVLLHFRRLSYVVLALLPVGIGALWMGGLMGAFDIPFNPANIMTLPLVVGIGVTNGIHILNRFVEEGNPAIFSKSTGKAVFVSGLTTISGFGCLILGQHLGIRSLGEVMSVGVATCMIAGLMFLPALINLLLPWLKPKNQQPSGDNA